MNIRVAIWGYGNLGKAIEQQIINETTIKLVAIFSNQNNVKSPLDCPIYNKTTILNFKNKIDLLILCCGSKNNLVADLNFLCQHFNTINTFDNHKEIANLFMQIDKKSKASNHISIISSGWDPGLFSYFKTMFYSILQTPCTTLWGKGVSLGHSNAVKQIAGVANAISFTIPCKTNPIKNSYHKRLVYVSKNKQVQKRNIKQQILNMPHYFKGQKVKIKFVSLNRLNKIKTFKHQGQVICSTKLNKLTLSAQMQSNPQFTALIVLSYVRAFFKIKHKYLCGAYTPLHFSPLDLCVQSEIKSIKQFC